MRKEKADVCLPPLSNIPFFSPDPPYRRSLNQFARPPILGWTLPSVHSNLPNLAKTISGVEHLNYKVRGRVFPPLTLSRLCLMSKS